ncbi:hypothetical protein [Natronomonas gomsonensis]|jgi:hypothetical protein|nr:hypothetical protein [Natronomonas gomsonensis]
MTRCTCEEPEPMAVGPHGTDLLGGPERYCFVCRYRVAPEVGV